MKDETEFSNLTVYLRSGNILRLLGVKRFEVDAKAQTIKIEQDTQGDHLISPLNINDVEAITAAPAVPDCDGVA